MHTNSAINNTPMDFLQSTTPDGTHRTRRRLCMAAKRIRVGFSNTISLDHLVGEKTFEFTL